MNVANEPFGAEPSLLQWICGRIRPRNTRVITAVSQAIQLSTLTIS
jgi:hypothetical protein